MEWGDEWRGDCILTLEKGPICYRWFFVKMTSPNQAFPPHHHHQATSHYDVSIFLTVVDPRFLGYFMDTWRVDNSGYVLGQFWLWPFESWPLRKTGLNYSCYNDQSWPYYCATIRLCWRKKSQVFLPMLSKSEATRKKGFNYLCVTSHGIWSRWSPWKVLIQSQLIV